MAHLAYADPLKLGQWVVVYTNAKGAEIRSKPLSYKAAVTRLEFIAERTGIAGTMLPLEQAA